LSQAEGWHSQQPGFKLPLPHPGGEKQGDPQSAL
jgi:hypothetical protein